MKLNQVVAAVSLIALAGCAFIMPTALLDRADRLVAKGDYAAAVRTYDELLARYPDDPTAPRALAARDILGGLLAARDDINRLRKELASREAELGRIKQDLDRLRDDLENLKRIDLREERRHR
jgi:tetratricopeptide (TPR) repeat protein